jgi:hypothetical protein
MKGSAASRTVSTHSAATRTLRIRSVRAPGCSSPSSAIATGHSPIPALSRSATPIRPASPVPIRYTETGLSASSPAIAHLRIRRPSSRELPVPGGMQARNCSRTTRPSVISMPGKMGNDLPEPLRIGQAEHPANGLWCAGLLSPCYRRSRRGVR